MIKKLTSLVLIVTILISMLTGCSVSDLGYLKLSRELTKLTEFSFENSTQIKVSEEMVDEDYNINFEIKGEANITDLNSMYMSFDMNIKVNDIGLEKPINFKIIDNQLFVSKNILLELVYLEEIIDGSTGGKTVVQELFNNDLKDIEYILLSDLDMGYKGFYDLEEEYNEKTFNFMNSEDIYEKSINYLTTTFNGFDTNLVKKTSNGYIVELTTEDILVFVENLLIYISENRDQVFDETVKYVEELFNKAEKEEALAELRDSKQDFYDFIDESIYSIDLYRYELDTYVDMVKGSKIKQQLNKNKNNFKEAQEIILVYEDVKMLSVVSNTLITPKDIKKVAITGDVILESELDDLYYEVEKRVNPVQEISVEWYLDDNSIYTYTIYTRLERNTYSNYLKLESVDDRIYLPLRHICETLGEEVEWDNIDKKAYIVRGEEKIHMSGIIRDSETFINIGDFEKLGYSVDYTQDGDMSTAIIKK